ncbi:MAG: hypothetical protein ACREQP_07785, partial [Candidatus Binatia bacterium]
MRVKKRHSARILAAATLGLTLSILSACGANVSGPGKSRPVEAPAFGPERRIGQSEKNPSTPFLRYSPDGRLHAIWTEDDKTPGVQAKPIA